MTATEIAEIETEIAAETQKRDSMRDRFFCKHYGPGKPHPSRAAVTTHNANVSQINDRIHELRQMLKATK